jgi:carbon-monoxide dehydrogenase large subunit
MTDTQDRQTSGLGFVGQRVKRVEDERFLIGAGEFVADLNPDGVLHTVFVRSPFPHATINSIDVSAARTHPGVHRVFTAAEINAVTNQFVPFFTEVGAYSPLYDVLSEDRVRHIGDPVAMVIAESRYIAEDAAELVEIDYEELEATGTIDQALQPGRQQVWDRADGNILADLDSEAGDVDAVFAAADRVITQTLDCPRQANQPMETRGSVVLIDDDGHLTIHSTSQAPHFLKWAVAGMLVDDGGFKNLGRFLRNSSRRKNFNAARKTFMAKNKSKLKERDMNVGKTQISKDKSFLRQQMRMGMGLLAAEDYPTVKAGDIGGAFGSKGPVAREDIALAAAAKLMGRSVQWIEDRVENLLDGGQAREERFTISIAVDDDGTLKGLKVDAVLDHGAYAGFPISPVVTPLLWKLYMPGAYDFKAFGLNAKVVATNKGKVVPYRGPWANETWMRERMLDIVAAELGMSPFELRQKNVIRADQLPRPMITGPDMDETMSVAKTLDRAIEMIDFDQLEKDKAAAEARGHRLGIGIASYHEAAPGPPNFFKSAQAGSDMFLHEDGRAEIAADGTITMFTSQSPHGQSHQTTYTQVAADEFGVAMEDVNIVWGDTDRTQFSFLGTGGSRGGPLGAGVMRMTARELRDQVAAVAADMLEASKDDIEIIAGNIHVAGVPSKGITYKDVAAKVAAEQGVTDQTATVFSENMEYEGVGNGGWSVATHVAVVDIDLETGMVEIPRYLVVEDCGPIINPGIVDGQVRGGVAQGIGAVFYEKLAYDENANLQSTTYMDYLIPTAMEIPSIEIEHMETLTAGENDARGVGEGGMIGAPAALTNAVSDALGVQVTEQYLPPYRLLELAGVIEPS